MASPLALAQPLTKEKARLSGDSPNSNSTTTAMCNGLKAMPNPKSDD
jgi:hypothetical protein